MAEKATTAQSIERERYVAEMLVRGYSRPDIIEYCRNKWNIERAQTDNYIAKARKGFLDEASRDRQELLSEALATTKDIQKKAYDEKDLRVALMASKENAELAGLKTIKVEQKVKIEGIDLDSIKKVLTKEQRNELAKLADKPAGDDSRD